MGLRSLIQKATKQGITKSLGDISEDATYASLDKIYGEDGSVSDNSDPVEVEIKAVFTQSKNKLSALADLLASRVDADYTQSDVPTLKALVAGKQLSDASVTPKVNDTITRGDDVYTISEIEVDPVGAAYKFTLRLP